MFWVYFAPSVSSYNSSYGILNSNRERCCHAHFSAALRGERVCYRSDGSCIHSFKPAVHVCLTLAWLMQTEVQASTQTLNKNRVALPNAGWVWRPTTPTLSKHTGMRSAGAQAAYRHENGGCGADDQLVGSHHGVNVFDLNNVSRTTVSALWGFFCYSGTIRLGWSDPGPPPLSISWSCTWPTNTQQPLLWCTQQMHTSRGRN